MSRVRIYRPARTATQSGRARCACWVLEFPDGAAQKRDPLMGWAGCGDTRRQLRLEFPSREDAVAYARRQGLAFEVEPARERKMLPKSYADNFGFGRQTNWTH